jgi:hypothetical protein
VAIRPVGVDGGVSSLQAPSPPQLARESDKTKIRGKPLIKRPDLENFDRNIFPQANHGMFLAARPVGSDLFTMPFPTDAIKTEPKSDLREGEVGLL